VGLGTKLLGSRVLNFGPCAAREHPKLSSVWREDLDAFIFILIALLTFGGVFDVSLVADYVVSSHRSMRIALNSVAC